MKRADQTGETMTIVHANCFFFISKTKTIKVPFAEILYIEQSRKQLLIKKDGKDQGMMAITARFKDLPYHADERFYKCHSYLIINLERAVSMSEGKIIFDSGDEKHMGRDAFRNTRNSFNRHLLENR